MAEVYGALRQFNKQIECLDYADRLKAKSITSLTLEITSEQRRNLRTMTSWSEGTFNAIVEEYRGSSNAPYPLRQVRLTARLVSGLASDPYPDSAIFQKFFLDGGVLSLETHKVIKKLWEPTLKSQFDWKPVVLQLVNIVMNM